MTDAGPMPIAGPVFTEWYWTPLLFVIFAGPPILAVAALLYRLGRRTGWRRRTRAAAALVLAPTVVLGGAAIVSTLRFRHAEAVEARSIAFATFSPDGLHQTRAEVYAGLRP